MVAAGFPPEAPTRGGQACLPRAGTASGSSRAKNNYCRAMLSSRGGLPQAVALLVVCKLNPAICGIT